MESARAQLRTVISLSSAVVIFMKNVSFGACILCSAVGLWVCEAKRVLNWILVYFSECAKVGWACRLHWRSSHTYTCTAAVGIRNVKNPFWRLKWRRTRDVLNGNKRKHNLLWNETYWLQTGLQCCVSRIDASASSTEQSWLVRSASHLKWSGQQRFCGSF
jgi:hypothetical protein